MYVHREREARRLTENCLLICSKIKVVFTRTNSSLFQGICFCPFWAFVRNFYRSWKCPEWLEAENAKHKWAKSLPPELCVRENSAWIPPIHTSILILRFGPDSDPSRDTHTVSSNICLLRVLKLARFSIHNTDVWMVLNRQKIPIASNIYYI